MSSPAHVARRAQREPLEDVDSSGAGLLAEHSVDLSTDFAVRVIPHSLKCGRDFALAAPRGAVSERMHDVGPDARIWVGAEHEQPLPDGGNVSSDMTGTEILDGYASYARVWVVAQRKKLLNRLSAVADGVIWWAKPGLLSHRCVATHGISPVSSNATMRELERLRTISLAG
jgi:hypothetical protein